MDQTKRSRSRSCSPSALQPVQVVIPAEIVADFSDAALINRISEGAGNPMIALQQSLEVANFPGGLLKITGSSLSSNLAGLRQVIKELATFLPDEDTFSVSILVPEFAASQFLATNGRQADRIAAKTQTKLVIANKLEGLKERILVISGSSPHVKEAAEMAYHTMLERKSVRDTRPPPERMTVKFIALREVLDRHSYVKRSLENKFNVSCSLAKDHSCSDCESLAERFMREEMRTLDCVRQAKCSV